MEFGLKQFQLPPFPMKVEIQIRSDQNIFLHAIDE